MDMDIEGLPLGAAGRLLLLTCHDAEIALFLFIRLESWDSVGHLSTTSAVLPTPNPKAEKKELITLTREEKGSDTGTSHDGTGAALSPVGPQ